MTTAFTPPLPISTPALTVTRNVRTSISTLVLVLGPLAPTLFLGTIIITRVTSGPAVSGTIFPGTATHPGHATLNMTASKFDALARIVTPFDVVLTYDSITFIVSDLRTIPPAPALP